MNRYLPRSAFVHLLSRVECRVRSEDYPHERAESHQRAWHGGEINRPERARLLGHGGALWFTGLSGSGKSTIAVALEQALYQRGVLVYRLDGDNIRWALTRTSALALRTAPKTFAVWVRSPSYLSMAA